MFISLFLYLFIYCLSFMISSSLQQRIIFSRGRVDKNGDGVCGGVGGYCNPFTQAFSVEIISLVTRKRTLPMSY